MPKKGYKVPRWLVERRIISRMKTVKKRGIITRCLLCKKEFYQFPSENKNFCSNNCANKGNAKKNSLSKMGKKNPMYGKRAWNYGLKLNEERKKKHSLIMKELYRNGRKIGFQKENKTSSQFKNGHIGMIGEKNPAWQGGKSFEEYGQEWNDTLKENIRKRYKYKCQICGQFSRIVHHIDYNKKNNNPNNLITLCLNCHLKTNGNRKNWINYFNEKRK